VDTQEEGQFRKLWCRFHRYLKTEFKHEKVEYQSIKNLDEIISKQGDFLAFTKINNIALPPNQNRVKINELLPTKRRMVFSLLM